MLRRRRIDTQSLPLLRRAVAEELEPCTRWQSRLSVPASQNPLNLTAPARAVRAYSHRPLRGFARDLAKTRRGTGLASQCRMEGLALDVATPVPLRVVCTIEQWQVITMIAQAAPTNQLPRVRSVLTHPEEVRESRTDPNVLLFYRRIGRRWMAGVVKRTADHGFLIAVYNLDSMKPGVRLWPR